ncbi:MAG: hypothetical protein MJZ38_04460, partial [archaeon]|nr:hypothetical protein [archaeon]
VRVERTSDIEETQILETDTSCGSYIFRTRGYGVVSRTATQIELEGSLVYADTLSPGNLCGGGVTLLLGRDGIAYRFEETQMWSKGVIYKAVRKLLSISVDGRVYDDIKWVDEGEAPDDEEDSPGISEGPCSVSRARFLL